MNIFCIKFCRYDGERRFKIKIKIKKFKIEIKKSKIKIKKFKIEIKKFKIEIKKSNTIYALVELRWLENYSREE